MNTISSKPVDKSEPVQEQIPLSVPTPKPKFVAICKFTKEVLDTTCRCGGCSFCRRAFNWQPK